MRRVRTTIAGIMTAAALTVGLVAVATPAQAQAIYEQKGPASCSTEIRVASKTTGYTTHSTSIHQIWQKGYKNNSGATSYTAQKYLAWVQTTADNTIGGLFVPGGRQIASSGYACK